MSESIERASGSSDDVMKLIVAQRRCVILAIVGSTPSSNGALTNILQSGFLSTVKLWLDDILNGTIGKKNTYLCRHCASSELYYFSSFFESTHVR